PATVEASSPPRHPFQAGSVSWTASPAARLAATVDAFHWAVGIVAGSTSAGGEDRATSVTPGASAPAGTPPANVCPVSHASTGSVTEPSAAMAPPTGAGRSSRTSGYRP